MYRENMLKASKSALFESFFAVYNRNLIKRRFHSLHVAGLEYLCRKSNQSPLLIYANHSSWWDGLVAFEISRKTKLDSFMMMEEKQLKNLFLFRRLGAFSVVRENPRRAVESLNYAVDLLKNPHRTLWIFPQGEILPNDLRPINFYNGLSRIIEKAGKISCVPLAIRYEFLGEFNPQIFVKIGLAEPIEIAENFDSKKFTASSSNRLTNLLDELKEDIININFNEYEQII